MNSRQLIIDRFEGGFAVCEDGNQNMVNINKALIQTDAPEGSVLIIRCGVIEYDEHETIIRKNRLQGLLNSLF